MNIVEHIINIINSAPIDIDASFVATVDTERAMVKVGSNSAYRTLVDSYVMLYQDSIQKGILPASAAAVVISAHDDMMRLTIRKAIKKELERLGANDLEALTRSYLHKDLQEKILSASEELTKVEGRALEFIQNYSVMQFKYSLQYAAEKWGSQSDQKVVNKLITKIKAKPLKKVQTKV